jgi:hypothetical protein
MNKYVVYWRKKSDDELIHHECISFFKASELYTKLYADADISEAFIQETQLTTLVVSQFHR